MNLKKSKQIAIQAAPIVFMVILIPIIPNDFALLAAYVGIISISFFLRYDRHDWIFFVFWLTVMTASESLFISTWVETFQRNSLFWLMPIWLPILWAYGFVAIRRATKILDQA